MSRSSPRNAWVLVALCSLGACVSPNAGRLDGRDAAEQEADPGGVSSRRNGEPDHAGADGPEADLEVDASPLGDDTAAPPRSDAGGGVLAADAGADGGSVLPADAGVPDAGCASPSACCAGCWDGARCLPGTEVSACGSGGGACHPCNDGNPCTADRCTGGSCSADKLTGDGCPNGVCSAGQCRCGGPGEPCCVQGPVCEGTQACQRGRCGECGSEGTPCCAGNTCATGNLCAADGMCRGCGGVGQLCCTGSQCLLGLACGSFGRCGACGGASQPCCPGSQCTTGNACGATGACEACGAAGQMCCAGNQCASGSLCNGGRCQPCGAMGQRCCASGNACQPGSTCGAGNTCVCGGVGQPCCGGSSCASGCCSGGLCQPGATEQACGASGACGACAMGQVCKNQSCAACGAPGQICCAGQACGGARTCLDGLCLREVTLDCTPTPTSLTGEVVFNETTTLSVPNPARGRVGHYPIQTSHMWNKYFVTFDCAGAPGQTGLQQATLSLWQTAYNAAPGDRLTVEHLVYATLDYAEFLTKPLDTAGSLAAVDTSGYQTLDVTTSMQRDLVDGRSPTQFRLDLPTTDMTSNHYVEFETAIQSHPPKLQLRYRIP